MIEDKELRQILDETLDWLSDLPEEEIRQHYSEMKFPRGVDFVWEIGGTEYTVVSHFKNNNADDIVNIVGRLLDGDVSG